MPGTYKFTGELNLRLSNGSRPLGNDWVTNGRQQLCSPCIKYWSGLSDELILFTLLWSQERFDRITERLQGREKKNGI